MRNDIRMTPTTQKKVCEYFNGDTEGTIYTYRSGGFLVEMYTDRFGTPNLTSGPSRWTLCDDTINYLYDNGRINEFFTTMLSLSNLKKELSETDQTVVAKKRKEAVATINNLLVQDDLELIDISGRIILHQIEDTADLIGSGGFANVYLVPGTRMVEKKLKDEFKDNDGIVSRFKQEFYIIHDKLSGVNGIIEGYEYNADSISYTMEYCESDLKKYISESYLDETKRIDLIMEILQIMSQVHERKVWHRDLSPKNIFIKNEHPVIADFGLGKVFDEDGRTYMTIDTSCNGTLEYCDPRQFQGLGLADGQSDIYSLGRIINYIMTKDSDNFNHSLSMVSTIATETSLDARFHSITEMLDRIEKITRVNRDVSYTARCEQLIESGYYDATIDDYLLSFEDDELIKKLNDAKFKKTYLKIMPKIEYNKILIEKFSALHNIFLSPIGHTFALFDAVSNLCVDALRDCGGMSQPLKAVLGSCIYDVTVGITRWGAQAYFQNNVRYLEAQYVQETIEDSANWNRR